MLLHGDLEQHRTTCVLPGRSIEWAAPPAALYASASARRTRLAVASFVRSFVCAPHVANVCWYLSHSVRYSTAHPTAPLVIELYQKEAFGKATRLASASLPLPLPLEGSTAAGAAGAGPAPSLDFSAAFQGYETPRVCARYRCLRLTHERRVVLQVASVTVAGQAQEEAPRRRADARVARPYRTSAASSRLHESHLARVRVC